MNEVNVNQNSNNTEKNSGNLIPVLIIIAIIIAGGVYAYFKVQEAAYPQPSSTKVMSPKHNNSNPAQEYENDPYLMLPESTSPDPNAIETDLNITDLDAIEADLDALDQI